MAPPRTFKTAFLADVILRYPGPVIATTTKADLFTLTSAVRSFARPVHVFNPQHIGGVPSTFCWSPVDGCQDPAAAIRRADAFAFAVSQKGVEDGTFWSAKASDYLRGYFHAAALARYDLRTVAAWASGADPHVPERILAAAGADQWALTLAELRSEAHKTAATVRMHVPGPVLHGRPRPSRLRPALSRRRVRYPGVPERRRHRVHDRRGRQRGSTGRAAVRRDGVGDPLDRGADGPGVTLGPAYPPLLMGLDQVTQICPVPLPSWLSDSGGKGIQVVAVVHGEAQLAERWGDHGRQVVLDTSSVEGVPARHHRHHHAPGGQHAVGQASWKIRGQDHATRHDVATPDMIRQLPAGFALVIRGGCAPVIAPHLPRAWRNPAYRRARRLHAEPVLRAASGSRVVRTGHSPSRARRPDLRQLPLELTMPGNDPLAAILDQLAAHHEQIAQHGRLLQEHAASLTELTRTTPDGACLRRLPPRAWPGRTGGSFRPPDGRNPSPGCGPGWSRCTGPVTGTWPPPWPRAGKRTTCACTGWTSRPAWSVLYLQPLRTPGLLSAQAEYQARILLSPVVQDDGCRRPFASLTVRTG